MNITERETLLGLQIGFSIIAACILLTVALSRWFNRK